MLLKQSSGGEFAKDKKFLFVSVPNRKGTVPKIIIFSRVLITNVVHFISFYINLKLTNVTLNCTIFFINVNITDSTEENYIEIAKNTHQYLH